MNDNLFATRIAGESFLRRSTAKCCFAIPFLTAILFVAAIPKPSFGQWELSASENSQLESYLGEIRVESLLVEHLETATARETDLVTRRKSAGRLLTLYAQNMMSGRKVAGVNWREKSELLLLTYPELETPTIRLSLLQASYLESESKFQDWWGSGKPLEVQSELVSQWSDLNSKLVAMSRILDNQYQDQIASAQSQNRTPDSARLLQTEGLLLHTNYLRGWSSYFLGTLVESERKLHMQEADKQFRIFLQIDASKALSTVDESWFDFSSLWQLRSFVGLAMAQRGLNYPNQAKFCFDLIESNATTQTSRDRRFVWELNSHLYLGQNAAALEIAERFSESAVKSRAGRVGFWIATLEAGSSLRITNTQTAFRFFKMGLVGLTRDFDTKSIERFLNSNKFSLGDVLAPNAKDFESLWVGGFWKHHLAQRDGGRRNYQDARIELLAALESKTESTTDTNVLDRERCRYVIARIDHQLENFAAAAESFLEVSQKFDKVDGQLAAESQWLATRSLIEISKRNPRELIKANQALDAIVRRFPGSSYATRAEFENLRVNLTSMKPEDAIRRLESVAPTSLNYPVAINELVKLRYKLWLTANNSESGDTAKELVGLMQSELSYRKLPNASNVSKLKATLLVVDALLRDEGSVSTTIRQRLDAAKRLVNSVGKKTPAYNEYRYYEFLFANWAGDTATADQEAIWLSENAQGTRFVKSALVQLAQNADQQFRANATHTDEQFQQLISIFERLTGELGDSPQILNGFPNARIAFARLAELKLDSGRTQEARAMLKELNRIFPNNKTYLHSFAKSLLQSNEYESSIPIWRKLSGGVEPGTELWFESKYQLANALYQSGEKAKAKTLHEQTRRLSPNLPEQWEFRFEELAKLLQ